MPEGRVYVCSWRKTKQGWRLWTIRWPDLVGEGASYELAEEALMNAVGDRFGDFEAVLEYDPPLPVAERYRRYVKPELALILGDTMPYKCGPEDQLFSGGVCRACKAEIGTRTPTPLCIDSVESGFEGGFAAPMLAFLSFFSQEFLSLLTPVERSQFEWRAVQRPKRARKAYYELVAEPAAPFVGVKGFDAEGWECPSCGHRHFSFDEPDLGATDFVCRADLPDPLPSVFAVGSSQGPSLCITRARWSQLVHERGSRGVVGHDLGVVSEAECERQPRLTRHWSVSCSRCEAKPWFVPSDRRVWPRPVRLRHTKMVQWLVTAVDAGDVAVIRQPVAIDVLLELLETDERLKAPLVYSFRCPECWKLGRVVVEDRQVSFVLPWK